MGQTFEKQIKQREDGQGEASSIYSASREAAIRSVPLGQEVFLLANGSTQLYIDAGHLIA